MFIEQRLDRLVQLVQALSDKLDAHQAPAQAATPAPAKAAPKSKPGETETAAGKGSTAPIPAAAEVSLADQVRQLAGKLATKNRARLVEELKKLGSQNLTGLAVENYGDAITAFEKALKE